MTEKQKRTQKKRLARIRKVLPSKILARLQKELNGVASYTLAAEFKKSASAYLVGETLGILIREGQVVRAGTLYRPSFEAWVEAAS